jgi:hypothetical protein
VRDRLPPMTGEHVAPEPRGGRLSPWADAAADAPGWQITTRSRRLAVAVATTLSGRTVRCHGQGEWQACIPHAVLTVVVIAADADALRCRLSAQSHYGVFVLAFAPWPVATVLTCPLAALPAQGQLSVRDVRVITRMGRTVRYLVPAFAPS